LDGALSSTRLAHPGALRGVWPAAAPAEWLVGDGFGGPAGGDQERVTYVESIRARLWERGTARTRGEERVADLDGHEPLMLVKVSALLAQLAGRREVTEEDWALAGQMWATSCRVRDHLIEYGQAMAGKAAAASRAAYVEREGAAESRRLAIRASAEGDAVERVARRMAIRIHEHGAVARRDAQSALHSRDRSYFDDAVDYAVGQDWLLISDGHLTPSGSRPG
jgi:hypothetical protein